MAITTLLLESFEGYDLINPSMDDEQGKWDLAVGVANYGTPRSGIRALGLNCETNSYVSLDLKDDYRTVVIGLGFRMDVRPNNNTAEKFLEFKAGTTKGGGGETQVSVGINQGGVIFAHRGDMDVNEDVLATGTTILAENAWYYLEFRVVCDDSLGELDVWIDGVVEIGSVNLDTSVTTDDVIRSIRLQGGELDPTISDKYRGVDDVYVRGDTAITAGGALGVMQIVRLNPNEVGNSSLWEEFPALANTHTVIDETYLDPSDYLEANGANWTVGFEDIATSDTIEVVQLVLVAQIAGAGCGAVMTPEYYRNFTTYQGTEMQVNTKRAYLWVNDADPDTGSNWTETDLNDSEFGAAG